MAKDKDTGIDPVATDGDPGQNWSDDEVERRRQLREARELEEEQQVTSGNGGRSIDDQDPPAIDEEDDGQLFVWEQGRKVTLGTIIARGTPVEHAFVFGGKRLKGSGGLIGHDEDVLVVVRGRVGKTSIVPTRDDDEKVTKVTIETHIASRVIAPANSEEAMHLLAGVLDSRGIKAA